MQGFEGGVLVLLADQQRNVEVAGRDKHDLDACPGQGGQRTGAIACGMHPLDETLRDSTPALEMPIAVSASFYYTVTLDFGDCAPDSVTLRYWNEQCWGDTQATAEKLTVQRQDDGTYTAELFPSVGIFEVDAQWDAEDYCGRAFYSFCTKAAG